MNRKQSLGKLGERCAVDYLVAKGKTIKHINLRLDRKEVDIVFQDGDVLVFAEVKTRANFAFGYPETAVDARKQAHIKAVADLYLADNPSFEKIRFDVLSVIIRSEKVQEIHHIEDAFY